MYCVSTIQYHMFYVNKLFFLQVNAEKQMNEMKVEGMYIHTVRISRIGFTFTCIKENILATMYMRKCIYMY